MIGWSVPDWLAEVGKVAAAITAIIAAVAAISKTRGGKYLKWVFHKVVGEPVHTAAVELITETITPQLSRLEDKNDRQHAENKQAIEQLNETFVEHRLETRDHLWELRQQAKANHTILEAHFNEAKVRDERLSALELKGVDVRITATPTSEVPAIEPPTEET